MALRTQEYLGIQIDLSKENNLSQFSKDTLKDRYFWVMLGATVLGLATVANLLVLSLSCMS